MTTAYKQLFSPLTVKTMTLRNRLMMTPMGTNYADPGGGMNPMHMDYYFQRAKGGTGLIILENVCVDFPLGSNGSTQLRMDHDCFLPALYRLCEGVHSYGACIAVQINHAGASAKEERIGMQPASASVYPTKRGAAAPRPLTTEEIYDVVKKFGEAARRAQIAGFDAVEIHAGHNYLLDQFISPLTNDRSDEFGGSLENRARLVRLVAQEIRQQVGAMYPIIMRVTADSFLPGGITLEDTLEWLQYVDEYIDLYDVSAGENDSLENQIDASYHPDGWRSYMARAVKEKYGKPVVTMGNIRDPKAAEELLVRGDTDLIGMGRGLIADPAWANKAREGREDEIIKCISCSIGCAGNRILHNRPIRCTVNPSVGGDANYQERCIQRPCNVVVAGGGTAGLEAACTAAEVGCTVFLLEKEDHLGGRAAMIAQIPDKKRLADFPQYLIRRAEKLENLYVMTNTEASAARIEALKPDLIVCATGSKPLAPPIPGLAEHLDKGGRVQSIEGMIAGAVAGDFPADMAGKRVVVIGGGAVGLDVVEYFAPRGAEVSIVEMLPVIGRDLDPTTKSAVTNLMERYGVQQLANTALREIRADRFVVEYAGETRELPFDHGFLCLGMKAHNPLFAELTEAFEGKAAVIAVGDSVRARRIIEGTREGRDILCKLEMLGYM